MKNLNKSRNVSSGVAEQNVRREGGATPDTISGLYDKSFEHDSCGVGFVADIRGRVSHQTVKDGITVLKNLVHRGALGGDMKTGDGAGMLLQIPHQYFSELADNAGVSLPGKGSYGAGFFFMPRKPAVRKALEKAIEDIIINEGGLIVFRRDVPVKPDCLGKIARDSMPFMKQFFVTFKGLAGDDLERRLYVTRRRIEKEALKLKAVDFYISSFSCRTIVYKGMFAAPQFEAFYPDLKNKKFSSAFALVHQRYSTNTFPSWAMAQPFRGMAHNGEINTIKGNMNYMRAREATLASPLFGDEINKLFPVVTEGASDSAIFDNTLELLVSAGRPVEHAMMMMVPEAFGRKYHISEDKRSFYEYHSAFMEPWDGPAAIVFTDGVKIGAALDRNGLRPLRYLISKGGKMVAASEAGVLDIAPEDVIEKGRLGPGKMILVDTAEGRVKKDNEIKSSVSRRKLYRRWLEKNRIELKGLFQPSGAVKVERESLARRQKIFGYDFEELNMIITPMAENAQEPVGSMGNDEAPAVLSERPQLLYKYFKQLFAQVTNPPIDPYRENLVMSLMSFIGRERNLLGESPLHCRQLKLAHPVLTNSDIEKLKCADIKDFNSAVVPMLFDPAKGPSELKRAVHLLCREVEKKTDEGYSLVIISDRGVDRDHAPIPALLAVSSVNRHLVSHGKRHLIGLVAETGEAREVTDFAALIAFGSSAVNPYLAFETLAALKKDNFLSAELQAEDAIDNYITAVKKGLLKIMSKMGVSTIRSYKGALMFEAVGLNSEFVDKYFGGVPSRIEGIGIDEIAAETLKRHGAAFAPSESPALPSGGHYSYRRFSENHLMTPEAIAALQKAVREGDYGLYKKYSELINGQSNKLCTLRGLFSFKKGKSIPLDEVEPVESIVKRFVTSAMSFGSISKEAHETMAIAMNRLGAASNSGEGGEDKERYKKLPSGDSLMSAVKQVASGRFGVSINYLVHARELQIKMAQGAKPGEGGQLPGHKVNRAIADIRYSTPGVMLISPPPHHDIYSIEDLSQLIFDLKNANTDARISVKLVSEAGVGTVAAGVAKGKADMVLISGGDGGTGASPLSSIKHAGIPWEIGLAETQQTLVLNKLRERIRVQVDGQMRTGRDIVVAALLGAEEYGFGTVALVTMGCVLVRKCHLNTCPAGIATQDEELRKRFSGKPEHIMNFMRFAAQDAREIMAELGFRSFDEMIGRSDLLQSRKALSHWKAKGLDFSKLLKAYDGKAHRCTGSQKHDFSQSLDMDIIKKAAPALDQKKKVSLEYKIRNRNRAAGTMLSSRIARLYGEDGLPEDTIRCKFTGVAGQSFGAFLAKGVTFELAGDSNDYMGKGLSGGRIILYPSRGSKFRSQNNIITGNVCLFGATGGEAFIRGMAGERFAVRNSGATAIVEGAGDHACEYMTGGRVVILGPTGVNFAAGMSGGIAYVLDENQLFDTRCNLEMVDLGPVTEKSDEEFLYKLIKKHVRLTRSAYAARIIRDWDAILPMFVKVMPIDYKKALDRIKREQLKESEVETITEEVFG
ncbi:glutamate synthase large subunit [bacterium]|nr:glutamate synthase large subunit [bacterium]MBU3929087.1 glutamate synthase large subunit [bacterium]MBU4122313.1 glutamate synthase large subunit [bacterium]